MMRALLAASLCAGWALAGTGLAHAQAYPTRPIRIVVPFPAGGPTDGVARIVSDRLGAVLGQTIVVENHGGGAGGSIGAKAVATADPDGYTILMTPGGALTTGPAVHRNIGYDPAKVFTPVGLLMETPNIISVHPSLPAKSLAEAVAYAKANPGKISWGSQGFGTAPHLLAEMFKLETGVNIVHSGWAWWLRPEHLPPSSTNSMPRSATALPSRRRARDSQTSAPRSRSARRPNSASCSPTSLRSGPPSQRPPTSRWNEVRRSARYPFARIGIGKFHRHVPS